MIIWKKKKGLWVCVCVCARAFVCDLHLQQCLVCIKVMSDLISSPGCRWGSCFLLETLNHSDKAAITCLHTHLNTHGHTRKLEYFRGYETLFLWHWLLDFCVLFVCCCYFSHSRSVGQKHGQLLTFTTSTKSKSQEQLYSYFVSVFTLNKKHVGAFSQSGPQALFLLLLQPVAAILTVNFDSAILIFCFWNSEPHKGEVRTEGVNSNKED